MKQKQISRFFLLGSAWIAANVQAAPVVIADTPMAVRNTAKSNIMFTVDNSGGTDVDMLLTTYNSMYYETGVTPTNNPASLNGNFYLLPLAYRINAPVLNHNQMLEGDLNSPDANHWRVRAYQYNAQYYNPFKVYTPWPGTDSSGAAFADANPYAVKLDPYANSVGTLDITQPLVSGTGGVPQAHTFLSATTPASDITASGGRYYNSAWYPAVYYNWVDAPNFTSSITVTAGGSGYATAPTVTISGGGGTGATATATITGGVVTAVTLTSPGTGYTTPPTVSFSGGGGSGAAATATVGGNGVMDIGEGVRYEIRDPGAIGGCTPTDPVAKIPGCPGHPATYPNGNTYAQEIQNFANWFQYYRTPLLTLKGALGKQLETLGGTRAGLVNLEAREAELTGTGSTQVFVPVADMGGTGGPANLSTLRSRLYNIRANLTNWGQPLHERMNFVYSYFRTRGSQAPIQYACQQNFNVISTPGYMNESSPYTNGFNGNTPSLISNSITNGGNYDGTLATPYSDTYSNTLADWSAFVYDQNLRTDLTAGQVPLSSGTHETNPNPHLTTYVMSPGAQPTLQGPTRFLNPMTADPWTITPTIAWPQPVFVDQTTVDDLWHTAVNGRGKFVNDTDIYGGLKTVLNDIFGRIGASAAVAVSNANISPGDNFSYASSYNSGNWTGDLQSYPIDTRTGQASTTPRWVPSAQVQLDNLVQTSTRTIATYNGTSGIPFRWASLDAAHQALLNSPVTPPGTTDGQNVLAFLRGDRLYEGTLYRTRGHVLGDIINAEPVILRDPQFAYADAGYTSYKVQYRSTTPRKKMVFQPANDGMLHAFSADTGAELWAYVPGLLFNSRLAAYPGTSSLVNLSMRSGFSHLYMVDGTPTAGDVDSRNTYAYYNCATSPCTLTSTTNDWHALLVGGLNKGGRGYYALDVTVPDKATTTTTTALAETELAAKVKWEFPNAATTVTANIGYSYGKPYITKTKAAGWVVLVTSGYNNGADTGGDGLGHLFVLNAWTGALIKDIPTTAGSSGSPSGLGQIVGYSDNAYQDNTVKFVYGGDLQGNVWRFDLTGPTPADWKVDLFAQLANAGPQPITTAPVLGLSGGQRMVFVGTGQYLGDPDVTNTSTQSMYGLIDTYDPATPTTVPAAITRSQLNRQQLTSASATSRTISNATTVTSSKGWFVDFDLTAGERIVTDPAIAINSLVFTTNIPSNTDPCKPGGSSWFYTVDFATGGMVQNSTAAGSFLGNALASRPILVKLPNGNIIALVRESDASTASLSVAAGGSTGIPRRVSWREVRKQ